MKNFRFNLVLFCFCIYSVVVAYYLVSFQITKNDYWRAMAQGQQKTYSEVLDDRGGIYIQDRLGQSYPLAINRDWEYVYISPREVKQKEEDVHAISESLSSILDIDSDIVLAKLEKQDSAYEVIKRRLTQEEVKELRDLNFAGVYVENEVVRYYPQNNLASQLVGFVGGNNAGQYGIEEQYNSTLEGSESFKETEKFFHQHLISKTFGAFNSSSDITLTIDYNIQFMAESLLEKAVENLSIEGGTILVGDPNTGKIVALANYPSFNPNEYFQVTDFTVFKNPAIHNPYEPGSIFKPITMAIALNEDKVTPTDKYYDTGSIQIKDKTIRNYAQRSWGEVTMTEVLEKSINTATVHVENLIGHETFKEYIEKFGFFEKTDIDLPGEVLPPNVSFKEGYDVNYANAAFGQGIEVTSMQMFKAFSALANGGRLVNPYIVEENKSILQGERVISPKTSLDITSMMVSVTENGFAKTAQVPGYYVAGKTGTAQIPWAALGINKPGYSDKTIQGFIGYAPAFNPQFLILIKLDNPQVNTSEYSAAPIFGELGKYILDYYQIPPEREL